MSWPMSRSGSPVRLPSLRFPALLPPALLSLCLLCLPALSGCYVVKSGYFQVELMLSRVPIEKLVEDGRVSAGIEQRLRLLPEIKAHGQRMGLSSTDNYDTMAWHWERDLNNLSACDPLSFTPKLWRFPIVGEVPYLGFFRREDLEREKAALEADGYEVWTRGIGAYSTLGWFRDPLLPHMMQWGEADLAETVFHELAHATLWIPGSVSFNESFASFVGEEAAHRYLTDRYGADHPVTVERLKLDEDWRRWNRVLNGLYRDLNALYQLRLPADQTLAQKAALFAGLPDRVRQSDIFLQDRFIAIASRDGWNNARMIQYRAYNTEHEKFAAVLAEAGGDLPAFIELIRQRTQAHRDNPYEGI